jgi:hypothetical protein
MNDDELNRQLRTMVDGAAAPLSQAEVVLRASSPARKSRRDWHLTEHRLIVVAVAAVIVVVFFVPLPSLSLFNRLSHTGLSSNQSPAATIPAGWVPVTLGGARISVPAPWWVLYNSPDCPWGKEPGEVLVNPTPTACPAPTPGDVPKNVIELYSFHGHHYGHLQVINGITVYWSGGNVYEVPSLGISIAIIGPLGKRVLDTLTRLPDRLPFVDLSATPAGWVPVAFGDAQISVPANWDVLFNVCITGSPLGDVYVNPSGGFCGAKGPPKGRTTVMLLPVTHGEFQGSPSSYGQRSVINGISVYDLYNYGHGPYVGTDYLVPSLGVEVTAEGPLARRVMDTLSRSPRTVALASGAAPRVPSSWRSGTFDGISFSIPGNWPIRRTKWAMGIGGGCVPVTLGEASQVVLSTDEASGPVGGCLPLLRGPVPTTQGLQIDQGPYAPTVSPVAKCFNIAGLSACLATAYPYSILVLRVTVPGRSTPVIVSIGLAGNGMIARTILYSLKAVNGCSHGACTSSRAIPSSWVTHNSHSADELTWTQTGSQLRGVEVEQNKGITSDSVCKTQVVPNYMEYRFPVTGSIANGSITLRIDMSALGSPGSGTDFVGTVSATQMTLGSAVYRPGSSNANDSVLKSWGTRRLQCNPHA